MPYKRFATFYLLPLATRYLNDFHTTYRSVVQHERCKIGYPVPTPEVDGNSDHSTEELSPARDEGSDLHGRPVSFDTEDASAEDPDHQAVIPPSLPWRFIGWLGSLTWSLTKAREMILSHNPNSLCHRKAGSVDPFKARSDSRMATLETARQLLLIIPEWESCFGRPFFPQFATRSGFD